MQRNDLLINVFMLKNIQHFDLPTNPDMKGRI